MMAKTLKLASMTCLATLLAACAAQPPKHASVSVAIAAPIGPAPMLAPLPAHAPPPDVWTQLRESFVLDDCGNPRSQGWARRLTRNPRMFSAQLQDVLPLLAWVQDAAEHTGVPGEFVLLPMVESSYDAAEPGRRGDPAGMWQIMPRTANALGLNINREYDGRLDPAASTRAVMAMLKKYNDELHDWRLVDMAFNAGEYKIAGLVDARDGEVNVPHLPVGSVTRDHLAKLMALACIVRDPARFEVDLPQANDSVHLTLVDLPQPVELAAAASAADIPLAQLHTFNPGYRGKRMPDGAPHHLLLPQRNAQRLTVALDAQGAAALVSADGSHARPAETGADGPRLAGQRVELAASHKPQPERHRVARGESLWSIARRYKIDPGKLRVWNELASDSLRPGQSLLLSAPD